MIPGDIGPTASDEVVPLQVLGLCVDESHHLSRVSALTDLATRSPGLMVVPIFPLRSRTVPVHRVSIRA